MSRLSLLALLVGACSGSGPGDFCADTPTFTNDIRPTIIEQKCIQCHSEALMGVVRNGAPADLNFDTYETTEPRVQEFADAISSGREPPMGLNPPLITTSAERDVVSKWRMCNFPK